MNNNTTSSSSTVSNTTPHQSQDPAEPLDGAACCASDFSIEEGTVFEHEGQKYRIGKIESYKMIDRIDECMTDDGLSLREHLADPNAESPLKAYLNAQILGEITEYSCYE